MSSEGFSRISQRLYQNKTEKNLGRYLAKEKAQGDFKNWAKTRQSSIFTAGQAPDNSYFTAVNKYDTQEYQRTEGDSFRSLAPSAPDPVREAWNKAVTLTGKGSDGFLSSLFELQTKQRRETGSSDLLGKTAESAISAVEKAISNLEKKSGEVVNTKMREYREQEMSLYREFLFQLKHMEKQ